MGQLADEAKKRNPYLTLQSGETIIATYRGYKLVPSTYDPTKENFRFILGVEIETREYEKYWDTGSNKVAMIFDTVETGERIKISKQVENQGQKNEKTRWEVQPINNEEEPLPTEE